MSQKNAESAVVAVLTDGADEFAMWEFESKAQLKFANAMARDKTDGNLYWAEADERDAREHVSALSPVEHAVEAGADESEIIVLDVHPKALRVMVGSVDVYSLQVRKGRLCRALLFEDADPEVLLRGLEGAGFTVVYLAHDHPDWERFSYDKKTEDVRIAEAGLLPYTWGELLRVHRAGPYAAVECVSRLSDEVKYHSYVNDESTRNTHDSLREALAAAIAYEAEGPNHRADAYFMRMLRRSK